MDEPTMKITISSTLISNCARCSKDKGGIHQVYSELDTPIPGNVKYGWPPIVGSWLFVCDGCLKEDDVRPEPGEEFEQEE